MTLLGPPETLDMKLYYSGDQARALLQSFSPTQLHAYFINELFDLLLMSSYTVLYFIGLTWAFPSRRIFKTLAFVPAAFDFIETSFILYATKFPGPHAFFDWLGYATFLKWTTGTVLTTIYLYGLVHHLRRRR